MVEFKLNEVAAKLEGPEAVELNEIERSSLMVEKWAYQNWKYFAFGVAFWGALAMSCLTVSTARWRLRSAGMQGASKGGFRTLRPPEWMVWPLIATALLLYADRQWPGETLRTLAWSGALGLFALYMLTGVAILVYLVHAFRPNPFLVVTMVFILIVFELIVFLPLVGLFDTWGEFRRKIDSALAARQLRDDSRDDGAA